MSRRSSALRLTSAAPTFSSSRLALRVSGMGTMSSPWASSQARASWLSAMPLPAASASSWRCAARFFAKFSPCQRGSRTRRMSSLAYSSADLTEAVRKPRPSGEYATNPIPSFRTDVTQCPWRGPAQRGSAPGDQFVELLAAQHTVGQRVGGGPQSGGIDVEVPLPGFGGLALGCLDDAADSPQGDRHVGTRDFGADPAVPLGVGEHGVDQPPYLLDQVMLGAGTPQARQAASVGCLVRACRLKEILQAGPAGPLYALPGNREHGGPRIVGERTDQRVLGREPAVEGSHAHAGAAGDLLDAGFEAVLGEHVRRGIKQTLAVLLGVPAQWPVGSRSGHHPPHFTLVRRPPGCRRPRARAQRGASHQPAGRLTGRELPTEPASR